MRRVTPGRIWVTRTQPDAEATAERLRGLGWTPVVAPLLVSRAIPRGEINLAGVGALAFTSAAGVRAFADLSPERGLAVFAVGETTARAARETGFTHVRAAGGDVAALAQALGEARPGLVLNPAAREPAADLVALLAARGVRSRSLVVYETLPAGAPPPDDVAVILVHSPRAARLLADLITPAAAAGLTVFAISEAAAAPLRPLPFAQIAAAAFPNEASLLGLLGPLDG